MKKKSLNELISENDDHLVGSIVSQCREIMNEYPTVTQMTACYNLIYCVFSLFCIQGSPKNLKKLAKQIYDGLLSAIE